MSRDNTPSTGSTGDRATTVRPDAVTVIGLGGMIHAFALAKEEGVDASDLAPYMAIIAGILAPMLPANAAQIDARAYGDGGGGLGMMATAVDHVAHLARSHKLDSAQIDAVKRMTDRAKELGHGDHTWAATYEALLSPRP
ncbi:imine reductase family protein [Streptomyces sp. NPDC003860]